MSDVTRSDAAAVTAAKVKMADMSGTQLSDDRGGEAEPEKRQERPWGDLPMSGKVGITTELPETLGFYDLSAVKRRQREHLAGTVKVPHRRE